MGSDISETRFGLIPIGTSRAISDASFFLGLFSLFFVLTGCVSSNPKLFHNQETTLVPLTKTIVYMESNSAKGVYPRWHSSLVLASLDPAHFSAAAKDHSRQDTSGAGGENSSEFWAALKPYTKEVESFHLEKSEERNIWRAVKNVVVLRGSKLKKHSGKPGPLFFHRTTRQSSTQATIFIQPMGVYLSAGAKKLGVSYDIHVYVKNHDLERGAYQLAAATIQASRSIPYPDRLKHFNMLTAPAPSALASRMKVLFADNGVLFLATLKEAMQKARWKVVNYFSGHSRGE